MFLAYVRKKLYLCSRKELKDTRMKNIAFIINPISGAKETQNAKKKLPKLIMQTLDSEQWLPNIAFTEYAGHATELAYQYARMGFDAVVAVGGDGTVNEVARGLRDTKTAMGIIPMGSGNGFARHLNIPIRPQRAIEMLNHSEPISVDYGLANGKLFVSTCGTGFDALIADHFAGSNRRGFTTYLQNILKDVFSYTPQSYHLVGDGLDVTHKAFLITFANANQWGYEALIAPKASVQDGKMDIMLMSSHALLGSASLALRLFAGSIDDSHFMDTLRAREVTLIREEAAPFHIDGDPVEMEKDIHIKMVEDGLRVLVEKRF
ncbi:MAG: diacylglycerol kinase family lipid kinase [Paludibacteraceae bacterium]|nr:diacylglycerol kinase family lipid kinase [Paludibacteraceae bacterium]